MRQNTVISILGFAGFTVMADNWVVSPILPAISADLHVQLTRAALLITAYMIPFGLFQLIFGPLADRYGKRQVINYSMLVFTLTTALCAVAGNFTTLAVYRALTGVFAASAMPVSLALIGDLVPMKERQAAIGYFMGISFLGQGLSMAVGGSIAFFLNWRGVFGTYSLLAAVSTVLLFTAGRRITCSPNRNNSFFGPYRQLWASSVARRTYLVILLEGILIVGTFSYLGAYLSRTYHLNYLYIGLTLTGFGLASVIGGRIVGRLAGLWGRKRVLVLGLICATAAEALFFAAGATYGAVVVGVALLGFGFIFTHSTLTTLSTEFAAQARGAAMSLVAFCFMGGGGVGTAIGGFLIAAAGFTSFFGIYGLAMALLIFLAMLIVRTETVAAAPGGVSG
ncbi:MAG TPA: MFS transporter [Spirochaetia bacterium]|nr:MFS transporter [Spirochaetia bacterium]